MFGTGIPSIADIINRTDMCTMQEDNIVGVTVLLPQDGCELEETLRATQKSEAAMKRNSRVQVY